MAGAAAAYIASRKLKESESDQPATDE
jgi:hypothetical protein